MTGIHDCGQRQQRTTPGGGSGHQRILFLPPEAAPTPFTYAGRITFWEPMITMQYLESKPNQCTAIKLPAAYAISGYYPTEYCIRHRPSRADYTVSLEGFTYRQAP